MRSLLLCFALLMVHLTTALAQGPPLNGTPEQLFDAGMNALSGSAGTRNDLAAVVAALAETRAAEGRPHAIVLRTRPGCGVPTLERREKAHFVRVEPGEWDTLRTELERHAEATCG